MSPTHEVHPLRRALSGQQINPPGVHDEGPRSSLRPTSVSRDRSPLSVGGPERDGHSMKVGPRTLRIELVRVDPGCLESVACHSLRHGTKAGGTRRVV